MEEKLPESTRDIWKDKVKTDYPDMCDKYDFNDKNKIYKNWEEYHRYLSCGCVKGYLVKIDIDMDKSDEYKLGVFEDINDAVNEIIVDLRKMREETAYSLDDLIRDITEVRVYMDEDKEYQGKQMAPIYDIIFKGGNQDNLSIYGLTAPTNEENDNTPTRLLKLAGNDPADPADTMIVPSILSLPKGYLPDVVWISDNYQISISEEEAKDQADHWYAPLEPNVLFYTDDLESVKVYTSSTESDVSDLSDE